MPGERALKPPTRVIVRRLAALLAAGASMLYFLIGLRVVKVLENPSEQVGFGLAAGIGFAVAALLIVSVDQKVVWIAGAVLQALIIFMYFSLAPERVPSFEVWGIVLRVLQIPLVLALVHLGTTVRAGSETQRPQGDAL